MRTQIHFRSNSAFWNKFKWGEILHDQSIFRVVPRSRKNIFKMFDGLGLNEELLFLLKELDIKFIEVPFCGEILETTTNKWLSKGIPSPYCSDKVDQQLILPLDKINIDEVEPPPVTTHNKERIVDVIDDKENFFLRKRAIRSVRGWIEWQANTFTAAVLMPKKTFKNALIAVQQSLGINRNLGKVFIDNQDVNRKAFDSIAHRLGSIYRTSTLASKYRLNNLDLVDDNLKKELDGLHISNLLSEFV